MHDAIVIMTGSENQRRNTLYISMLIDVIIRKQMLVNLISNPR